MCIFKKKKAKSKQKPFMKCDTLEQFKKDFILFHKQDIALENNRSYFNVEESNMDGNIFGESFDNCIRLKFLEDNNPEFMKQIDKEELLAEARRQYEEDIKNAENEEHIHTGERTQ